MKIRGPFYNALTEMGSEYKKFWLFEIKKLY